MIASTSDAQSRRRFLRRSLGALLTLAGVSPARVADAADAAVGCRSLDSLRSLGMTPPVIPSEARSAKSRDPHAHPTPRPGIDASKVLTREQLTEHPAAESVFAMVRRIPQVVDGIRCQCGCAELDGFYSLLSCYEADGMAQHCVICQGEARLAFRMHEQGKTLDQIRAAIDAKFGQ